MEVGSSFIRRADDDVRVTTGRIQGSSICRKRAFAPVSLVSLVYAGIQLGAAAGEGNFDRVVIRVARSRAPPPE